ncbi:hypothetical protein GCM10010406_14560 [Streptomyces thermolineatus]|uniref:Uncharacterized protein n=1 Tax=Streptomyces thermolineatus TaxID=44033 RepID=A0ABN3L810_9ACTN
MRGTGPAAPDPHDRWGGRPRAGADARGRLPAAARRQDGRPVPGIGPPPGTALRLSGGRRPEAVTGNMTFALRRVKLMFAA